MQIYQRLKDLREDMDMNQKQVGEIIGTTGNYYGDYENGKRDIPTERMIKLAKFYQVSMDYITGLTNDKGGLHKINEEDSKLLSDYHNLNERNKGRVEQLISDLIDSQEEEKSKSQEIA